MSRLSLSATGTSKRKENNSLKLSLLSAIAERKNILFSKFNPNITHEMKTAAWTAIVTRAKALGLVAEHRDGDFVRDKMFGVWKSRALRKRDNARRTGTSGGKDNVLDEVDLKILEIIGRESPVVDGLNLLEGGDVTTAATSITRVQEVGSQEMAKNTTTTPNPESAKKIGKQKGSNLKTRKISDSNEKDILTIELLKTEIYHRKLQSLKLERELELPPSPITQPLLQDNTSLDGVQIYTFRPNNPNVSIDDLLNNTDSFVRIDSDSEKEN